MAGNHLAISTSTRGETPEHTVLERSTTDRAGHSIQTITPSVRSGMPIQEMMDMAKVFAASGLFPKASTPSAMFALMMLCESEGLHPAQALKRYHIIEGRPTMRADAMQADFMRLGGLVRWERSDDQVCSAWFIHPKFAPDPGFNVTVTLSELVESGVATTWNEKKQQVILKDNYKRHPRQMLRARAISEGVRAVYPGVVAGIYAPEEVDDYSDAQTVTIQAPVQPAMPGTSNSVGGGGNLDGSVILPAPRDPRFAAKVQEAGTLSGVARPPSAAGEVDSGSGAVDYGATSGPITDEQRNRLRVLVQNVLKFTPEEWQSILIEFGVAKMAELSAVDAEAIIRRLEERADNDDPFGAGSGDPGADEASQQPATEAVPSAEPQRVEPSVAPGTPTDGDPRVPLINEALAIVGRLNWDADQLTRYLTGLQQSALISSTDIMDNTEDEIRYVIDDLSKMLELGYGNGPSTESPADDLMIPDATRPVTKANTAKQARAAKQAQAKDAANPSTATATPATPATA